MALHHLSPTSDPHAFDPETRGDKLMQWAPIAAGPLLWTVVELASYWIVEAGCNAGWLLGDAPENVPARMLVALIGGIALLVVGLLLVRAWRGWDGRLDEQAEGAPYANRQQFMRLAGVTSGSLFGVAIAYHTLTVLFLPMCDRAMQ